MLFTGTIINFILFAGHMLCLAYLNRVFEFYKIDREMERFASIYGDSFPDIITIFIALCFLVCAMYGLSACGYIFKLPFLKLGIFTIAAIFLLRALWGITIMISNFTYLELSSFLVSTITGLLYLFGGMKTIKKII